VAKGSTWYLVANTRAGLRTFRVSRIEEAKILEKSCKRPANFDLGEHWRMATERFLEGWPKIEVVLKLEARAAASMKRWHLVLEEMESRDGWETLRMQFDHADEALFMVLGLGSRAKVLEPEKLRERVKEQVRRMAEGWGD
jgi:predicted DNA-binding transcriptional regulator YafY